MTKALAKLGVVPNKTFKLEFPNIKEKYYSHFIRGYFDGDGSFPSGRHGAGFSLVGRQGFLEKVRDILIENCKLNKVGVYKRVNIYTLNYGGQIQMKRITDYLYKDATIFLQRKYDKVKNNKGLPRLHYGEYNSTSKLKNEQVWVHSSTSNINESLPGFRIKLN